MFECFNKYDTGFICVGCKPHPFGNEMYNFCGINSILWREQIVEGKYPPWQLGQKICRVGGYGGFNVKGV